ncbi:MAG: hypothetical protein M1829_006730 [Trizodia sp. TS-e1964]|nr:MAG: hypothetical protein M1829_006730 [Trizodia sp. TS-e1964]
MSGLKGVIKGGWHPDGKNGKKESWRGDYKGINQVSGWVGKGKNSSNQERAENHQSTPLSSLRDPSSFGPPPKNINFYGPREDAEGLPEYENSQSLGGSALEEPGRLDVALTTRSPPPIPSRSSSGQKITTSTSNNPLRSSAQSLEATSKSPPATKPKPLLPPRLPPRQDSSSVQNNPTSLRNSNIELESKYVYLNQGALSRLGKAGVFVPGLNIGSKYTAPSSQTEGPKTGTAKSSEIGELQSRFSKLSPPTSKPTTPSQGTSFAEKQAAIRTASSFRNDPSSISLADAKSAASTANNFRERHGDEVAKGYSAASGLNKKYGLAEKINSYAGTPTPTVKPSSSSPVTMAFKKPPPPPPPKKLALISNSGKEESPPPIPLASKPKAGVSIPATRQMNDFDTPISIATKGARDVPVDKDLDLASLWFARSPTGFPPESIAKIESKVFTFSDRWSRIGPRTLHTFEAFILWTDNFSRTKIKLTWDASNPKVTVKAEQKHFPPPVPLSPRQLAEEHKKYGQQIVLWCEKNIGSQVGNGECWTLANDALLAVAEDCKKRGEVPVMSSQGFSHGCCIYAHFCPNPPSPAGGISAAGVLPGDILQFYAARFNHSDGSYSTIGLPHHTAVVTAIDGKVLKTLEQNMGGVSKVVRGSYWIDDMVVGELRVFRPVGEWWCPLDTIW